MADNFLHGVEFIEVTTGSRNISLAKASIIGLVGVAPRGPKNTPVLVTNDRDAAQFGALVDGFNIPKALDAMLKNGAGAIVVVNTLDDIENTTAVTDEAITVSNLTARLSGSPIGGISLENEDGSITYTPGVEYSIDDFGKITVLDTTAISEGSNLLATYKKFDATKVLPAQIIGTTDVDGDRSGIQAFKDAYNLFGFTPKIFAASEYSRINGVTSELISAANSLKGFALIEAPTGTTVAQAIAGRGPASTINFKTSDKRAVLLYPGVTAYNGTKDENESRPYSDYFAGVWANSISNNGFWVSPSNKNIQNIVGTEVSISASISDATSEANRLNEVGIVTVFNAFGTGLRTWGNRSAAFPTNTFPTNFMSVQMTADVIHESIEQAMLQFLDLPINQALIDAIRESVNAFMRSLIARGAIIDGVCKFDRSKNSNEQIASGHLVFDIEFMPPVPGERITFDSFINIELLKSLV